MKKRIISAILVIVMSVLALASCAPAFNFAQEDLSVYVDFNYDEFKKALEKIEIEIDKDFTTDEDKRWEKVDENLLTSISDKVISAALDSDKLRDGVISKNDAIYYCYYTTYTDEKGKTYTFDLGQMYESTITGTDKNKHVVKLATYDKKDKLQSEVAKLFLKDNFDFGDYAYTMKNSDAVALDDKVVVSYTRTYNTYKKNAAGEYELDASGNKIIKDTITEKCDYLITDFSTSSTDPIVAHLAKGVEDDIAGKKNETKENPYVNKYIVEYDTNASYKKDKDTKATTNFEIEGEVKIGESNEKVIFTYSNVNFKFKLPTTTLTVKHTPYTEKKEIAPNGFNQSKIDLDDKELTYHIFPAYYIAVPEVNADSILQYIVASGISTTRYDAFYEDYKNGDKTVATLVTEVKNIFSETYEKGDNASETHKNLANLKDAITKAEAAVKEAGDDATSAQKNAVTDAKNKYTIAQRAAAAAAIKELTAAKLGEKTLADAIYAEHKQDTYDTLEKNYEEAITKAVASEIYELIFENKDICKIKDGIEYPEKLLKEFEKHLYESYEHDFYNGTNSTSKQSNYLHYGDLESYLYEATGAKEKYKDLAGDRAKAIEIAITAEAKEAIDPLLKLYRVAQVIEEKESAGSKLAEFISKDIDAGAYDAHYEPKKSLTDKQNETARKVAEKNAALNKESVQKTAGDFLINDKALKRYKKAIGSSAYRSLENEFGEINVRASLQFNKLFYYLTCNELEAGDNETKIVYTADGKLAFRNIKYTLKEK